MSFFNDIESKQVEDSLFKQIYM